MSFLLEGKPRRRPRISNRNESRRQHGSIAKDASKVVGGGQLQVQRPQTRRPNQNRVIPQQQQRQRQEGPKQRKDQTQQDMIQSVGVSMEQGTSQQKATHVAEY